MVKMGAEAVVMRTPISRACCYPWRVGSGESPTGFLVSIVHQGAVPGSSFALFCKCNSQFCPMLSWL